MCGLAGLIGLGISNVDLSTYHDLLYFTAVRGPHSTGVMTVAARNEKFSKHPRLVKKTGPSPYFIMSDQAGKDPQLKDKAADIFMAHCRWATVGAHTTDNAHPFDTGRYISCHNGTLYDSWSYSPKGSDKTDSLLMFEKMEQEGVRPVLEGMRASSAYAITMYDKKTRRVILARNSQRPLYVGISDKRDVMYWASEYGMLYAAASRNDVALKIFPLPVGKLYYIDVTKVKKGDQTPWAEVTLNFNPLESSTNTKRIDDSRFDWGSWQEWADAQEEGKNVTVYDLTNSTSLTSTTTRSSTPITDREIEEEEASKSVRIFTEDELAKASAHYIEGAYDKKVKKSERSQIMADLDKIIDNKMSLVDQLFEDVKAEQYHEAAQKAIEEAQGVTATRSKQLDDFRPNPNYSESYGENEECCICNQSMSKSEFMKAEACDVDGVYYYVCHPCQMKLSKQAVRR